MGFRVKGMGFRVRVLEILFELHSLRTGMDKVVAFLSNPIRSQQNPKPQAPKKLYVLPGTFKH